MTQVRFTSCPVAFASPPPTPFFAIPEIGTFVPTGSPLVPLLPTRNKLLTSPLSPHHPPRQPNHAVNETIALSLPVTFHVADDVVGRRGVLHVTTRRLVWFGDDGAGFEVPFQALTMHAVSTDTSEGFKPCIYAQVEGLVPEGFGENDDDENEDDDEDGDDEFDDTTELRLAPTDSSKLNDLFKTLCECAAMNPDSEDEEGLSGEDDDEDGLFFDETEVATGAGAAARMDALARFDAVLTVSQELEQHVKDDPGRFED
jgi:nucleotide-sensitive chloride channel 1A